VAYGNTDLLGEALDRVTSRFLLVYRSSEQQTDSLTKVQVRLTGIARATHPDAQVLFRRRACQ
jgi:hypothetical protein